MERVVQRKKKMYNEQKINLISNIPFNLVKGNYIIKYPI